MSDNDKKIRVGVGVMIFNKDGRILLGKRKGSHGAGEYSFPGGHLEYGESFEECAKREVMEECGDIEICNIKFQLVANVCKYHPRHDIYLGFIADLHKGEPRVGEPEKCESWDWYELNNLPEPLFYFCRLTIESYKKKNKRQYYDLEKGSSDINGH